MQKSIFKTYVEQQPDYASRVDFIRTLSNGVSMSKIECKSRKNERKKISIRLEMCRLEWSRPVAGNEEFEGFIDFRDIKEVRVQGGVLAILYGKKFCLQQLACRGKSLIWSLIPTRLTS